MVAESNYLSQHFCGVDANHPFVTSDRPLAIAAKVTSLRERLYSKVAGFTELRIQGDLSRGQVYEMLSHEGDWVFPKRWGIDFYHTYEEDLALLGRDGLGLNTIRTSAL